MSVKIMSKVWEDAPYEGGTLLVLLALADWSDDEGLSWPGVPRLAAKARLGRRQTQSILRRLEDDEIIATAFNTGRGNQNQYRIRVQNLRPLEKAQSTTERAQFATENVQPSAPDPLVLDPLVKPLSLAPETPSAEIKPDPDSINAVTAPVEFNSTASARLAKLAPRPGAKPRRSKPVLMEVPVDFKADPRWLREETMNMGFDRDSPAAEKVKNWIHSRRVLKPMRFATEADMLADLRNYLSLCAGSRRRAS